MTMTLLSVYIPPILLHDKCLYKTGSKLNLELSISPLNLSDMGQTMFNVLSFQAKNRMFEFNYQKIHTFKSVRCLKKMIFESVQRIIQ